MRMRIYIAFFHCMNQSIKMHLEYHIIQDMGQKMYVSFHIVTITRRVMFFFSKSKHNYKCDTDFIQQFNKQEVHMKRLTF